ncbi:sensor domain-containing diguanylate cyclase [Maridesulfovibrio frigidus]|uniref:sensor domain-containing diguanylate cyclase n=1 Tax=Maridesulfovibrio frigidus TaxID=340956 RepID=UPI0004E27B8E|nr:diguanylate cyclase [Maridesulfovibrio frigidus]
MSSLHDLEAVQSELSDLQKKHSKLKQRISRTCPECGQAEFKKLFANAASAIVILDAEGKIILTNSFFTEITGFSQTEVFAKPIHNVLPSNEHHVSDFLKNISSESECSANLIFPTINKESDPIWLDMSVKTLSETESSPKSSICIFKDITSEKENELHRNELIEELMDVKELQEENSAQLNLLLHELDDKNLKLKKEISERKKAEQRLRESEERFKNLSITDQLTGLFNRRHLQDVAHREVEKCKLENSPLCTLLMDVDNFKHFNDTYGHSAGDDVLSNVGKLIKDSIKGTDRAFRYGGEEFLVLLPETGCKEAKQTAERIRTAMEAVVYHLPNSESVQKTLSIGIAEYKQGESLEAMFKRADDHMFQAKLQGKNKISYSCKTEDS